MINFYKKVFWLNLSVVILFIIDRVSKWLALNVLPREGIFVIPDMTGFILERNQGIAYSISLPSVVLLLIRAYRRREIEVVTAFSLIIAGAVSNLLDRLQYEYVVDMLVLTSWPVFNLADLMILAGAVWLIIKVLKNKKEGLTK
jgi:signal peptidase II